MAFPTLMAPPQPKGTTPSSNNNLSPHPTAGQQPSFYASAKSAPPGVPEQPKFNPPPEQAAQAATPKPVLPPGGMSQPNKPTTPTWNVGGLIKKIPGVNTVANNVIERINNVRQQQENAPLSMFTHHLGSFKPTADNILNYVGKFTRSNPSAVTGMVSALAPSLVGPLSSTPFGVPGLTALSGLLSGGDVGRDTMSFFRPLVDKLSG